MRNQSLKPIKINDHLYQLGIPKFPVYLSLGKEGMLIEGGTSPTADIVACQLAQLGIDPLRIKYLALTHTHADHIGAVPRLRLRWPHLKVLAGPKAAGYLAREDMVSQFLPADRMINKIFLAARIIPEMPDEPEQYNFEVNNVIQDGEEIDLGNGVIWRAYETPGHSACHMSYYHPGDEVLASGDMTGYFDPERNLFWPNYFSSLADYSNSIARVAELPAETVLLSHNGAIAGSVNRFMHRALEATQEYHHELNARLDQGEDEAMMCAQQADWVYSFAPIASPGAINFLCRSLCKQSRKIGEQDVFQSLWQNWPEISEAVLQPTGTNGAAV